MKRKTDRFVVLDFDGVMTSCLPDGGSYLANTPSKYDYSKECLANLMFLLLKANAKVVISSNWRRFEPDGGWTHYTGNFAGSTYFNPLPRFMHDLGDKVVGTLPTDRHITKSEALILWLEDFKHVPDFVVFDDDLREGFQTTFDYGICNKFILTDPKLGLTMTDVNAAIDKFKEQAIS